MRAQACVVAVSAALLAGCSAAEAPSTPGPSSPTATSTRAPLQLPPRVTRGAHGDWSRERVGTSLAPTSERREGQVTFQCADAGEVTLEMAIGDASPARRRASCGDILEIPVEVPAHRGLSVSAVGKPGSAAQFAIGFDLD